LNNLIKYYPKVKSKVDIYRSDEFKKSLPHEKGGLMFISSLINYIIPLIYEYLVRRLEGRISVNNECYSALNDEIVKSQHDYERESARKHLDVLNWIMEQYPT
jgi:hypothetical protein